MGIQVNELNIYVRSDDFGHWHFNITPAGSPADEPNVSALLAALSSLSAPREPVRTVIADPDARDRGRARAATILAGERAPSVAALVNERRRDRANRTLADLTDEPITFGTPDDPFPGWARGENVQTVAAPDSLTDHPTDQPDQPTRRTRKVSTGGNKNHRWTLEDDEALRSMVDDGMRIAKMAAALKREKQAVKHRL